MKVVAAVDDNGHFHVVKYKDRAKVVKLLKHKIEEGDCWANAEFNGLSGMDITEEDAIKMTDKEFEEFFNEFTGRGRSEIVEFDVLEKI